MGHNGHGRLAFPPSGRIPVSVPLVGQRPAGPPEGRYTFWVSCFVKRAEMPLDVHGFTWQTPTPNPNFTMLRAALQDIGQKLHKEAEHLPEPMLIPVSWQLLEFTPQAVVEKIEEFQRAQQELQEAQLGADGDAVERARARRDAIAAELGLRVEEPKGALVVD